jgi:hypothetical protein
VVVLVCSFGLRPYPTDLNWKRQGKGLGYWKLGCEDLAGCGRIFTFVPLLGAPLRIAPIGLGCWTGQWGLFFLGTGFALVNQYGECDAHLIPFSQMVPPSVYNGVRRADGGFLFHPSMLPVDHDFQAIVLKATFGISIA